MKNDLNKISVSSNDLDPKWHLMNAEGKVLGRFASNVSGILSGKRKINYSPNLNSGDFVVVINAAKIKITGNKLKQKTYFSHSGYPGGGKEIPMERVSRLYPERIILSAVKGMLPKNKLRDSMLKRLKIYPDGNHPHASQLNIKKDEK